MDFTRPVRGYDHNRRGGSGDCAKLGNADLPVRQEFEQIGFKRLISTVNLINQQDRCAARIGAQGTKQRALDQEILPKQVIRSRFPIFGRLPLRLNFNKLASIIPFIGSLINIQPFITLKPNQITIKHMSKHFGNLGFANTSLAFKEKCPLFCQGQKQADCQSVTRDIARRTKLFSNSLYGIKCQHRLHNPLFQQPPNSNCMFTNSANPDKLFLIEKTFTK